MRILVTGGSGFIGVNLVSALARRGDFVLSLDVKQPPLKDPAVEYTTCSLLDLSGLQSVVAQFAPDFIFHAAARTDLRGSSDESYRVNTLGTANVIDAIRLSGSGAHLVHFSTRLVFSIAKPPTSVFDYSGDTFYGRSKIEAERLVRGIAGGATPWTIVRPTSIWGPWFNAPYRDFFESIRSRRYFNIVNCSPRKSFGYVGNSVAQLCALTEAPPATIARKVFWLSDYSPIEVPEFAAAIADSFGVNRPYSLPFWFASSVAQVGDRLESRLRRSMPLTTFRLRNLVTDVVYDTYESEQIFGPLPYSVDDGIAETVRWMRHSS